MYTIMDTAKLSTDVTEMKYNLSMKYHILMSTACNNGDYKTVQEFVNSNEDNAAIWNENIHIIVRIFKQCGHITILPYYSPFYSAVYKKVLENQSSEPCDTCGTNNGVSKFTDEFWGINFLQLLVLSGKPEMVKLAIKNPHMKQYLTTSLDVLSWCKGSKKDMKDIIHLLCQEGHIINRKLYLELTPLHIACHSGISADAVEALVEAGSDINQQSPFEKETPLIEAIRCNKENIVEYLLQNGAHISFQSNVQIKYFESSIIKLLLDYGFDLFKWYSFRRESIILLLREVPMKKKLEITQMLMQTGYRFKRSELWDVFADLEPYDIEELYQKQMLSLQRLSANVIRRCLVPNLYGKLKKMNFLPNRIKDSIMYL